MVRRFLLILLVLHVAYAVLWIAMDRGQQLVFERYAVLSMELIACVFYGVLIVAFYEARKTRLNIALAVQKLFWWFLITFLALPTAIGLVTRDAPYRTVTNPYTLWAAPAWLRTYIWIGLTVSLIGVLYEFYRANWGEDESETWPVIDRRKNPYGRRAADYATAHGGSRDAGFSDSPSQRDGGDY